MNRYADEMSRVTPQEFYDDTGRAMRQISEHLGTDEIAATRFLWQLVCGLHERVRELEQRAEPERTAK